MDASIKGENLKTFMRILQCASRYGDDLNIHASSKAWEMSVTNSSKSAFCLFKLQENFFCRWNAKSRKAIKCKLLVKSVLAVLGKPAQINTITRLDLRIIDPSNELRPLQFRKGHSDRDTRSSSVGIPGYNGNADNDDNSTSKTGSRHFGDEEEFTDDEDTRTSIESKLIVRLVCKHGVTKKHSLHLGSSDFLRADVDPDTTPSGFVIATRTLRDWLDNFAISSGSAYPGNGNSGGTDQLGWMFTPGEVRVKSWEGMGGGGLCTEIKVDTDEFQDYEVVGDRVDLTLPMKEFRATLMLAEHLSATLNVSFSEPGQPLTLTSLDQEFEDFSIFCAIATTACEAFNDVRSNSVEPKRSNSDLPPAPLRQPALSNSTTSARNQSQTSTTSSSRKRKGSETPSQSRKRSTLHLTPQQEPMSNVYYASSSHQHNGAPLGSRQHEEEMEVDRPNHVSPSHQDGPEALFFAASQRNDDEDTQNQQVSPRRTQSVRMSQAELLQQAGLDDLNLEHELEAADAEDEREMEEEISRSQSSQQHAHPPVQTADFEEERGRSSLSRQPSRIRQTGNLTERQSRNSDSRSPEKGKSRDSISISNSRSNQSSPIRGSIDTSNSGYQSRRSHHPDRVTDSISNDTTTNSRDNTNESGLVWDITIDDPSPPSNGRQVHRQSVSPTKSRSISPQKSRSSPNKTSSRSPEKQQSTRSLDRRTQHSPSKPTSRQNKPQEEEVDELTDDEEVGEPTQNPEGSTKFKSLFDD
ncbi:uncharacterized protein L201_008036 [Kwoniella dendrophila CBS 6074]|uniref:Cell cycle checkpoint control protein RAD9A n=1 Tax=Kwoniella dendrophila CBS 6074 TaxID=1295534 RepID=A0AAX4K5T4_9TREE